MPASLKQPSYIVAFDTREQLTYSWSGVVCEEKTLATGDYSIVGMESLIAVERKSLNDYWSCMSKRRFRDCLSRLSVILHSCVVVEADANVVLDEKYQHFTPSRGGKMRRSQITGRVAASITREHLARYKVPVWFAGDRERGQAFTLKFLETSYGLVMAARRRQTRNDRSMGGER